MTLDHVLVLPATNLTRRLLVSDTAPAQGTSIADRFPARVTKLDSAAGVVLAPLPRQQRRPCRTAVSVRRGVVGEVFMREAVLRGETPAALGLRHIGDDAVFLAALQRGAVVISDVGKGLQRLGAKRLLRRPGHLVQLAGI